MVGKFVFFVASLLLMGLIGYWIWSPYGLLDINSNEDKSNIAVEFHGLIFDVILFGIILTIWEWVSDRRSKRNRYKEEISDFLGWDEKEAMYRIVGNIKRLNKLGVSKISLRRAYLQRADLSLANLQGANLELANLKWADLAASDLRGASFHKANLEEARLAGANLEGARAYDFQKESLSKIMTEEQLNSMQWDKL